MINAQWLVLYARLFMVSSLLAISLAIPATALAQSEPNSCPIEIPTEETLGETILCDQLEVPQDWSDPQGRSIPISYVVLKSTSLAPLPDPVIYFQGGPGGSALNSFGQISSGTLALRADRDVIFFDQRGTAYSNDLFCPLDVMVVNPDTYDEDNAAAQAQVDALAINAFSDPDAVYDAVVEYFSHMDYSRCLPYFAERGIELEHYNTASTVRDSIALMQHLGYPEYNLYGGSYGATVVLSIMGLYDDTDRDDLPLIRTAVLDSLDLPSAEFLERAYEIPNVVLGILDDCGAELGCASSYPNIRSRTVSLLSELRESPLARNDAEPVTDTMLAEVLRTAVTSQPSLAPYIPRLIHELDQGQTGTFDLAQSVIRAEITIPEPTQNAVAQDQVSIREAAQSEIDAISAQLDAVRESVELLAASNAIIREAAIEASDRPSFIIGMIEAFVRIGGSTGNRFIERLQPYLIHPQQRTRAGLENLVRRSILLPAVQNEILGVTARLSDAEVREVFRSLTSPEFDSGLALIGSITNRVVNCNDRGATISNDVAFARYPDFEAPALIGFAASWPANYQVSCKLLGLARSDYGAPPPPITSDVRTLIVTGSLDTMTPAIYGYRAAETLPNSTIVEIPMATHVAGLFNECGKALVHTFILSPETGLNLSCLESQRRPFVMPDDPLPGG